MACTVEITVDCDAWFGIVMLLAGNCDALARLTAFGDPSSSHNKTPHSQPNNANVTSSQSKREACYTIVKSVVFPMSIIL